MFGKLLKKMNTYDNMELGINKFGFTNAKEDKYNGKRTY